MKKKGKKNMVAISVEIDKIIEAPSKKPTKQEAVKILRSCGILNKNNGVKAAYKEIIVKEVPKKHEKA